MDHTDDKETELKPFDWYEDTIEVEVSEFNITEKKRNITQRVFDLCIASFNYIALFTLLLYLIRFIFSARRFETGGISFDAILICVIVYTASLTIITNLLRAIMFVLTAFGSENFNNKMRSVYRWLSLTIWYMLNLYLFEYIKPEIKGYYTTIKAYLQSCLLASVSFTCVNLIMEYFYEYFLQKSMFAKMKDVDMSERILYTMKNNIYEISDSSSIASRECTCKDLFCFNSGDNNSNEDEEHIELRKWDNKKVGNLYFKPPEVKSLSEALNLAKAVFEKASNYRKTDTISYDEFQAIFGYNNQIALQAFTFFDSDSEQRITRKDFKDTIQKFYVDRVNLEKNFVIAKGFVDIVGDLFSMTILGFDCLAFLILFGIPLKDLVALALSSALLLNFLVSGMASDLYFNFMVLLSHPFDVGDEVIIDDVDYKVHKIGLSSTSFIGVNGGKIKFLNSVLWKKSLINMTRAPEKILVFNFTLSPTVDILKFALLKKQIHLYLRERSYDFFETFSLESKSESCTAVEKLECNLVLKCKCYKTKAKKFNLRIEVTTMLLDLFKVLQIETI